MKGKIDLALPYVDNSDPQWRKLFNAYSDKKINENINGVTRFRGQGDFFKYVFRSIDKYMPWINNVFLLVQSESQVPEWIETKNVKIITHDKFIPAKYLPTFNSCTIEMFLHKIPGLAEQFIYINDDFYALDQLSETQFFEDGKAKFQVYQSKLDSIYGKQCRNCHNVVYGDKTEYFKTIGHIFRPYLKSKLQECYKLHKNTIESSISRFRAEHNLNCYIYSLYLDKIGLRSDNGASSAYISPGQVKNLSQYNFARTFGANTACINDSDPDYNVYESRTLNKLFAEEFPTKCKYEIGGKAYTNRSSVHKNSQKPKYYLYF